MYLSHLLRIMTDHCKSEMNRDEITKDTFVIY